MGKKLYNRDPGVLSSIVAQAQGTSCMIKKPVLQTPASQKPLPDWPTLTSGSKAEDASVTFNHAWNKSSEKLILDIYRRMESGPPLKNKWDYVSKDMEKQKHKFSGEQCRLKIKSLKERYLKLKKKLNQSGSDNPTVPGDMSSDLEDTFSTQPDVHPVCTVDSEEKEEKKEKQIIQKDQKKLKGIEISSESEDEDMDMAKLKRKSDEKTEKKKCKKLKSTEELPDYTLLPSFWLGRIHRCMGRTSCHNGLLINLQRRQEGDFLKNHWSFLKIGYNLVFTTTSPRYLVLDHDEHFTYIKRFEFKFHPGCRHGTNRPSTADVCKIIEQNGKDAERRHQERLDLQKQLIDVLKQSLDKKT